MTTECGTCAGPLQHNLSSRTWLLLVWSFGFEVTDRLVSLGRSRNNATPARRSVACREADLRLRLGGGRHAREGW